LRTQCPVMRVHVTDSENGSAPPPVLISGPRKQVHEGFTGFQTGERGAFAAIQQLESKLSVKFDRTSHVTDGEGHCTDVLDHPRCSPVPPSRKYNTGQRLSCASKNFPSVQSALTGPPTSTMW